MLASVVLYRGHGLRQWDQLRQLAEVLGDGRQGEFVAGAARPSQAEAVQAKYAFEVCKQHLDLLPLSPRRGIGLGLRYVTGHVSRALVYTAWHFACRGVRTTLELQRTGLAVALAGAISIMLSFVTPLRGVVNERWYL